MEKDEQAKDFANKLGVKYIEENRSDIEIIQDNFVTAMYNVERLMGYPIDGNFSLAKFFLILEEIEKDKSLTKK